MEIIYVKYFISLFSFNDANIFHSIFMLILNIQWNVESIAAFFKGALPKIMPTSCVIVCVCMCVADCIRS